jgi:phytoene desaturase
MDVVRAMKSFSRAWSCFFIPIQILKIIVENKTAKAIVVNGERIDLI